MTLDPMFLTGNAPVIIIAHYRHAFSPTFYLGSQHVLSVLVLHSHPVHRSGKVRISVRFSSSGVHKEHASITPYLDSDQAYAHLP